MEYVKVKDLGQIVTGNTPSTSDMSNYGDFMPFIKATDIILGSRYTYNTEQGYSEKSYKKYKVNLVPKGSTCIVTIGSIGKKMTQAHTDLFVNQAINAILPYKQFDKDYIYYVSKYAILPQLKIYDSGTTSGRENISKSSFSNIKLFVEENLPKQQKIASILSTYDTLIENNNRRIRLLEQMAENLYKEWFVRFRFPGHEKLENGLPKEWDIKPLKTLCEFRKGKNITASEMCKGTYPVISAGLSPSGFHNKSNVHGISVTMSSSGANAGYISIHYDDIWAADCSYISEEQTEEIFYVYEVLNNIRQVINNYQMGAAQPHVYPKDINRIKTCIPPKELRIKANSILAKFHKEIDKLAQQNTLLTRQRDLLLPRLMSGKLEVKP